MSPEGATASYSPLFPPLPSFLAIGAAGADRGERLDVPKSRLLTSKHVLRPTVD